MAQAEFDDLFYFFDLLAQPADHIIGGIWDFLNHHEGDEGINGGGEHFFELVAVGEEGDAFSDGEFGWIDGFGYIDHCSSKEGRVNGDCLREWPRGASKTGEEVPYFPSGCTLTRTFFVPITFTTSPT